MDTASRDLPLRLHVSRLESVDAAEPENTLGALAYSPEMLRYLKHVRPARFERVERLWHQWWRFPYVRERLARDLGADRAAFVVRYHTIAPDSTAKVAALAKEYGKGFTWAVRAIDRAGYLVRRKYLPYYDLGHLRDLANTLYPLAD